MLSLILSLAREPPMGYQLEALKLKLQRPNVAWASRVVNCVGADLHTGAHPNEANPARESFGLPSEVIRNQGMTST